MSNLPAITKPSDLNGMLAAFSGTKSGVIKTRSGQELDMSAINPADLVSVGGNFDRDREPLFRITLKEIPGKGPNDLPTGKLYGKRSVWVDDPANPDKKKKEEQFTDYLGDKLVIYPLAIFIRRSYMPSYTESDGKGKPICGSHNYYNPDPRFAGVIKDKYKQPVTQCCVLDEKTGKLISQCPAARWKHEKTADGKDKPIAPLCHDRLILYGVISIPDENSESGFKSEVVYLAFQSMAEKAGKQVFSALNDGKRRGLPYFATQVEIGWQPAKASIALDAKVIGRTYPPEFQEIDIDGNQLPLGFVDNREFFTDEQMDDMRAYQDVVVKAEEIVAEMAKWTGSSDDYDDDDDDGFKSDIELPLQPPPNAADMVRLKNNGAKSTKGTIDARSPAEMELADAIEDAETLQQPEAPIAAKPETNRRRASSVDGQVKRAPGIV